MSYLRFSILLVSVFLFLQKGNTQNCERTTFRTIDGTCNNLIPNFKNWGAANIPLVRSAGSNYDLADPYNEMTTKRPNPRSISNAIFAQEQSAPNKYGLSSFVFTWGQFIDHDIGITTTDRSSKANIPMPDDEPDFSTDISFSRSEYVHGTGIFKPRDQINKITSWIDASQIYGSDLDRANWLRSFENGKLKTSTGNLLPFNTLDGERTSPTDPDAPEMDNLDHGATPHFVAGDSRANEQPGLTTLHTLFVREHNRICEELLDQGLSDDEEIYQLARRQVAGLIQSITYNEFLPALGIRLRPYYGYRKYVKPDIMNEFSAAAFRIGHTMVTEHFLLMDDNCESVREELSLEEAFFNPRWITQLGIDPFLKGLASQKQEEVDGKIIDGLRNFLFAIPQLPGTFGMDLAAINIQRGRDHGLNDYNSVRAHFTGSRVFSFDQIHSDPVIWEPLAKAYDYDINNIDPWVGMLCEEHVYGSSVGTSMYFILKSQFERIREGDFYYYENDPSISSEERRTIDGTRLTTIIKRNTALTSLQENVFKAATEEETCLPTENFASIECGEMSIQFGNGTILINGEPNQNYYYQIFNKSWRRVGGCGWRCGDSFRLDDLTPNTYRVIIYNSRWSIICNQLIDLPDANGLIDKDGDGIPEDKDCNDNDPLLSTIGATCSDGNPNTINDSINSDCQCVGDPIEVETTTITCSEINITYGNGRIDIAGTPGKEYMIKIDRIAPGWATIDNCVVGCADTKSYENLIAGEYMVRIWSSSWMPMCNETFTVDKNSFAQNNRSKFMSNTANYSINSQLFPNPGSEKVFLNLPDFTGETATISIFNNLGQQVQIWPVTKIEEAPITIDIASLSVGLYYVRATIDDKRMVSHKLLIER